ncbi:hypothetical protein JCM33374_g1924 [Metschnikowia sp. JCM 33374]|nr:hypothetical protein JCM33374_g1924 [Metschnikowia sp. JCM 33374]
MEGDRRLQEADREECGRQPDKHSSEISIPEGLWIPGSPGLWIPGSWNLQYKYLELSTLSVDVKAIVTKHSTPKMPQSTAQWYTADEFYDVADEDVKKYATVFHRGIYTFGPNGEVYLKFGRLNKNLKSLDDVTMMVASCCTWRVAENEWIDAIVDRDTKDIAVVGVLSNRYVEKNNLAQYGSEILDLREYNLVSIDEFKKKKGEDFFDAPINAPKVNTWDLWRSYRGLIEAKAQGNKA